MDDCIVAACLLLSCSKPGTSLQAQLAKTSMYRSAWEVRWWAYR